MSKRLLAVWVDAEDLTCGECDIGKLDDENGACAAYGTWRGLDSTVKGWLRCARCLEAESKAFKEAG